MKPADALPEMRKNAENSHFLGIQAQYALKCRHPMENDRSFFNAFT
jgi:hypothetical protein